MDQTQRQPQRGGGYAVAPRRQDDLPDLMTLGRILKDSGYFQDARSEAQAIVKVMWGREIGLDPIMAMTGIHVIEGKPTLGANLYASFIRRSGRYDYRVIESSGTACEIEFLAVSQKGRRPLGRYRLTLKEAEERGLTKSSGGKVKENWRRHPDAMLFARVISQGCRIYCPDVFHGHVVYTADELDGPTEVEADVRPASPEQGQAIEGEVVDEPAPEDRTAARGSAGGQGHPLKDHPLFARICALAPRLRASARAGARRDLKTARSPEDLERLLRMMEELLAAQERGAQSEEPAAEEEPGLPGEQGDDS